MAVTDALATAAEYRAIFKGTATDQDTAILTDLTSVTRYVERHCGRFFTKDASAVARVFIPDHDTDTLWVPDMAAAPTGVKVDTDDDQSFSDEDAVTGFEAWPLNVNLGAEPSPYYQVHLPSGASIGSFSAGLRVQVTAQWGWPDIPGPVKRAVIELTGILRMQSPRATSNYDVGIGQIVSSSYEARNIVKNLLDQYRLVTVP